MNQWKARHHASKPDPNAIAPLPIDPPDDDDDAAYNDPTDSPQQSATGERIAERDERDALAGLVMHGHLKDHTTPQRLASHDNLIDEQTQSLLDTLAEIYDIDTWDAATFQRIVLGKAAANWRPGLRIQPTVDGFRMISTTCPLAADHEADPRVCGSCQAFHAGLAKTAIATGLREVRIESLITRGDGACSLRFITNPNPPPAADHTGQQEGAANPN